MFIDKNEDLRSKFNELEMPSWIYIFPEGLRYNSESIEVLAMGRKYAAEYDLPQYKHVLIPRTKITYTAIECLKDRIQSIYDICIVYTAANRKRINSLNEDDYNHQVNNYGSLWSLMTMNEPPEVHIHINRIPIENFYHERVGISEKNVGNWLINLFEKKDKLLNMIYVKKKFDLLSSTTDNLVNLSFKETVPSFLFLTFSTLTLFTTFIRLKPFNNIFLSGTVFSFLTIKYLSLVKK